MSTAGAKIDPRTPTEEFLARLAKETLGVAIPSMTTDLATLTAAGSALAPLSARLEEAFSLPSQISPTLAATTLAQLAELISDPRHGSGLFLLRAGSSGAPLFFMPDLAGYFASALQLSAHLPADRPLCCVLLPERSGAPYTFPRLEDLACHCVRRILARYPNGPFHIAGYSFGGKLAYEVAWQLHAAGKEVGLVAIIDTQAFPRWPRTPAQIWAAAQFYARDGAYQIWNDLSRGQVQRSVRSLIARARQSVLQSLHAEIGDDIVQHFGLADLPPVYQQIVATHVEAMDRQRERPYPGRVTLIRARRTSLLDAFSRDLGWGRIAASVDVHIVAGDHWTLMMPPSLDVVVKHLRDALASSERWASSRQT